MKAIVFLIAFTVGFSSFDGGGGDDDGHITVEEAEELCRRGYKEYCGAPSTSSSKPGGEPGGKPGGKPDGDSGGEPGGEPGGESGGESEGESGSETGVNSEGEPGYHSSTTQNDDEKATNGTTKVVPSAPASNKTSHTTPIEEKILAAIMDEGIESITTEDARLFLEKYPSAKSVIEALSEYFPTLEKLAKPVKPETKFSPKQR